MTMSRLSLRVAAAEEVVVQERDIVVEVEGRPWGPYYRPWGGYYGPSWGYYGPNDGDRGVMESLRDGGDTAVRIGEDTTTTIRHIRPMALTLVMGTDTLIR